MKWVSLNLALVVLASVAACALPDGRGSLDATVPVRPTAKDGPGTPRTVLFEAWEVDSADVLTLALEVVVQQRESEVAVLVSDKHGVLAYLRPGFVVRCDQSPLQVFRGGSPTVRVTRDSFHVGQWSDLPSPTIVADGRSLVEELVSTSERTTMDSVRRLVTTEHGSRTTYITSRDLEEISRIEIYNGAERRSSSITYLPPMDRYVPSLLDFPMEAWLEKHAAHIKLAPLTEGAVGPRAADRPSPHAPLFVKALTEHLGYREWRRTSGVAASEFRSGVGP